MVLSGWQSARGGDANAVSCMDETLLKYGTPAVLCLGSSARNTTVRSKADGALESSSRQTESSEQAATHFCERLARGSSIAKAVRNTYEGLRKEQRPDWHLVRLYARAGGWGQLAKEAKYDFFDTEAVQHTFLDSENKVRVATAQEFVGRRRLLQECVREL